MPAARTRRGEGAGRSRGPTRLNEQRVVEAAVAIVRRGGTSALTMRSLADELGVTTMAAYRHVTTKEELVSLVIDEVLGKVAIPERDSGPWDERLARSMTDLIEAVTPYPGLGSVMLRSPTPLAWVRLTAAHADILRDAGFTNDETTLAYATVSAYIIGRLHSVDRIREAGLRPELLGLEPADSLRRLDYVDFGVRAVIAGIKALHGRA